MGQISSILEDLHGLTLDEASKAALKRRLQSFSGGSEGDLIRLRHKQKQQAVRKAKRFGSGVTRGKRKRLGKKFRDAARAHGVQQLKRSVRGAAMSKSG